MSRAVYEMLSSCRPLPFSLSDLLLVVFLHDVEKPWKYELRVDGQLHHRPGMERKEDYQRFRMAKLVEYGIALTPAQENGIAYAEGEIHDYSPRERRMSPLAAAATAGQEAGDKFANTPASFPPVTRLCRPFLFVYTPTRSTVRARENH